MWIADGWNDYEVIDCSQGEKLERWGDYLLVRPDPQVIWDTPKKHRGWKKMNGHYHRSSKGGGEWEFFDLPEQWTIDYKGLTFNLKPFSFKHTGLFPEQAANWDWFGNKIRKAGRPVKVLNLFAYTGGATLAAAKAGAAVTHVDASKGMVNWAKENPRFAGLWTTASNLQRGKYAAATITTVSSWIPPPTEEDQKAKYGRSKKRFTPLSNCAHSFYRRNRFFTLLTLILRDWLPPC